MSKKSGVCIPWGCMSLARNGRTCLESLGQRRRATHKRPTATRSTALRATHALFTLRVVCTLHGHLRTSFRSRGKDTACARTSYKPNDNDTTDMTRRKWQKPKWYMARSSSTSLLLGTCCSSSLASLRLNSRIPTVVTLLQFFLPLT